MEVGNTCFLGLNSGTFLNLLAFFFFFFNVYFIFATEQGRGAERQEHRGFKADSAKIAESPMWGWNSLT